MKHALFKQFYEKALIGDNFIPKSTNSHKRAILTGALCIVFGAVAVIHLAFDLYFGIYSSSYLYFASILCGGVAFILNRKGHFGFAKVILLYSALFFVFVFGLSKPLESGKFLYYFPALLAAFALYGYKYIKYAILLSAVAMGSFLFSFYVGVDLVAVDPARQKITELDFIVHFLVAIFTTFFIIFFFIKVNYSFENYLRSNERRLNSVLQELEVHKQRMELAFKGSNAGLYDWDIKNDSIYHSPMWKMMLGYSEAELDTFCLEDFFEMLHPDDRNSARRKLREYLDKKSSRYTEEVRIKTFDGSYKWFMDSGVAEWDCEGRPVRLVGSIIDINEMKEAEAKIKLQNKMLEKTNEELDKFVYSTGHDLRAPLMSILGLIELTKKANNTDEIEHSLSLIANRVHRLDEFIGEIIDFSRNSRLDVIQEEIKLDALLRKIVHDLQYIDNRDKIDINVKIDRDFRLNSDKKRVETILKNLISNAYKYHNLRKECPFIQVSAKRVNGHAKIMVEDNGDGIKIDTTDRIFEMFFRGSEKSKGSGLGLYIAKEMTDKLNGKIYCESRYGEGSRFTIEIPQ